MKSRVPLLCLSILLFLLTGACSAPLPTATPVPADALPREDPSTVTPKATATPLPTATPQPTAVPSATPPLTPTPAAGYYRHAELGFWLQYPDDWFAENTGSDLPAVIISDPDDPVQVLAGGRTLEDGTELAQFAQTVKDELGLAETVDLLEDGPANLNDGTPAWSISLSWEDEAGNILQGQGYTAVAGGKGYLILLFARPEVMITRPQTIQAIAGSLTIEQPELFGVSRTNSLILLTEEPATLDPALTHDGPGGLVGHIFSGLVRLNADMQIEPDLAERWEVSADGTVYTFHLRPDVLFHNGRSLTAADVKTAWDRATNPDLNSPTAPIYLGDIVDVTVLDDTTLQVTIDGPKPYFLAKLAQPVAFVTEPDNVNGENWWQRPVGTGPFQLRRWQLEQVIILDRNADFYLTPPQINTAVFLIGSGGLGAYESGLVDVAAVHPRDLARLQDAAEPLSAELHSSSQLCTRRVVFDTTQPPFDDPAIRQAFSLTIDRQQLAEVVLFKSALPAVGVLPPAMPGYQERPLTGTFNVTAALDLIAASPLGSAEAMPALTFTAPGTGSPDPLAIALADAWRSNLGVAIETELLAPDGYADAIAQRHGHLFMADWCAPYPDPENMLDLLYHSASPANYGGYASPEVDALLETARTEADPAQRLALYQQAEDLIMADAASVPVVYPLAHVLIRPYIHNYQPSPIPVIWPAWASINREE